MQKQIPFGKSPLGLRFLQAITLLSTTCAGVLAAPLTGELREDTTWSGTVLVEGTLAVPDGISLRIEPGTRVELRGDASLEVRGQLAAEGSAEAPIYFTRAAAGERWKQILFLSSTESWLRHCVVEYADSAGDHKDYYDNDCDPDTVPPSRSYHEAITVIASRVELDSCVFQNLPDAAAGGAGDAIAVISDDPNTPGIASATIRRCRFLSIGQGVHTRYSYVLVEDCYFTGHNGDNDDVDLYGESDPPPLIRNNVFLNPNHDDMINPTRCSAVIQGNLIAGSDDHGIVLRDKCAPVLLNNVIYDCASAGIAVQNQCDAFIANNTIVNCGRGIRFFDHTGRWGPPYCLSPGSGKANVINTIIWDCPTTFELEDSPYTEDRGSHLIVEFCDVEGGQARASVSSYSTLTWGDRNLNVDPLFVNADEEDFRLEPDSPCIDAGTGLFGIGHVPAAFPLDGDGDGDPREDVGAFEFLLPTADSNHDGIPDGWYAGYELDPGDPLVASGNPDGDPFSTGSEWLADTDPTDGASHFRLISIAVDETVSVNFASSTERVYTLEYSTALNSDAAATVWTVVPNQVRIPGNGEVQRLTAETDASRRFFRVSVGLP